MRSDFDQADPRQIKNVVSANGADPKLHHRANHKAMQSESAGCARADKTDAGNNDDGQRKIRNGPTPMSEHNPIPKPNDDKENISFQFMEVSELYFANIAIGPSGLIMSFKTEYGTSMYCGPAAYAATW